MVRRAEWSEFDLEKGLWSIPAAKMKMKRDQIAPLHTHVVAVIQDLNRLTGRSRYLFPSNDSKVPVISDGTINKFFALIGYKGRMTGHGSRHTCNTLLSEHGWPEDWRELHLTHKKSGLKRVYDKAVYLPERQQMVQWYADFLEVLENGMTLEQLKSLSNIRSTVTASLN